MFQLASNQLDPTSLLFDERFNVEIEEEVDETFAELDLDKNGVIDEAEKQQLLFLKRGRS